MLGCEKRPSGAAKVSVFHSRNGYSGTMIVYIYIFTCIVLYLFLMTCDCDRDSWFQTCCARPGTLRLLVLILRIFLRSRSEYPRPVYTLMYRGHSDY
jgi:hypothetical protein